MSKKTIFFFLFAVLFILPVFAKEIPAELLTEKKLKRNPELSVSWDSVLKMKKDGKTVIFIDTRLETEFKKFHIPHSINIPLFAIKTKGFLKSADLILINEGYSYFQLEQECLNLRKAGFKTWIFNGGLNYWAQKGEAIEGNAFDRQDLNKIPPEAFFLEKNYEGWIMINVGDADEPGVHNLLQGAKNIPFSKEITQFLPQFKKEIEKYGNNPFLFVLIFNKTGDQYEKIEEAIHNTGIANVFYLTGGLDGYGKYVLDKAAVPQKRATAMPVVISDGKIVNKPCRSCQ